MNYPNDWPCKCGATKEQHDTLKIIFDPMDNLTYVEYLNGDFPKRDIKIEDGILKGYVHVVDKAPIRSITITSIGRVKDR